MKTLILGPLLFKLWPQSESRRFKALLQAYLRVLFLRPQHFMLCSFFPLTHSHTAAHTLHQPLPSTLSLVSFSSLPHTHTHTRPPLSGWGGGELQGRKKKKKLPRSHRKRQRPHVCVRLHDVYGSLAPLIRGVVLKWPFFHGRTQGRKTRQCPPSQARPFMGEVLLIWPV